MLHWFINVNMNTFFMWGYTNNLSGLLSRHNITFIFVSVVSLFSYFSILTLICHPKYRYFLVLYLYTLCKHTVLDNEEQTHWAIIAYFIDTYLNNRKEKFVCANFAFVLTVSIKEGRTSRIVFCLSLAFIMTDYRCLTLKMHKLLFIEMY